jgi:ABC-type transport system involved in multi-copper enzyme maturation permease subunit
MMAHGNEQEVEKAQKLITSAVVGLIIVIAAYAITLFIGAQFFKSTPSSESTPTFPAYWQYSH